MPRWASTEVERVDPSALLPDEPEPNALRSTRSTRQPSRPQRSNGPALLATRYSLPATSSAFTLVELLIGATLSGMVLAAVLSSYIFLGKSFARLSNQQVLESEARRTLATFAKDVQAATGISGTPSASTVTLTIPTTSGTTTVVYAYDSSAGTFTRTPSGGTALIVCRNITSSGFTIKYYDHPGNEYTSATLSAASYLTGIRQLALEFSTQLGVSAIGTQTQVYRVASSRMLIRNSALLQ